MSLFNRKNNGPAPAADPSPAGGGIAIPFFLSYQVGNLQGIGARTYQEDSFTIVNAFDVTMAKEQGLFFAVCDGMGGMKDGKLASETAISSLRQSFNDFDRSSDLSVQLKKSIFKASAEIEKLIGGDGGSTAVVGIIFNEKLYYASVGDSYFWLFRDGKLLRLNEEHNLLHRNYLEGIREGNMDPRSLSDGDEDAALTSFLGMRGFGTVDASVRPLSLRDNDILLACSDGVGGVVTEEEIISSLQLGDPSQACVTLESCLIAHARPHQDNYTGVIIRCIR